MNLPNTLSLIRLLLVPVFAIVFFSGIPGANIIAAAIFVAAALTDALDGYIARKYNKITKLGRVLDPLADKLMSFVALVCLVVAQIIPWWAAAALLLKEVIMLTGGLVIMKTKMDVPPSQFMGKFATAAMMAVCTALMLFPNVSKTVALVMICFALALMVGALIQYAVIFIQIMRGKRKVV